MRFARRPAAHRPAERSQPPVFEEIDVALVGDDDAYLVVSRAAELLGRAPVALVRRSGDAGGRRVPSESRKRYVGLAPDLPLLFPAAGAHDHESDVARDVKPCLCVVQSVVAAHLCRYYFGIFGRPGAERFPSARVGIVEHAADVVEETTRRKSGKWPTASWRPRPGGAGGRGRPPG